MKLNIKKSITDFMLKPLAFVGALFALSSCESVFDGEGDCDPKYYVKFVYDMNLLNTDAFYTQVKSVDLYIFDKDGNSVAHYAENGEPLTHQDYLMPLDLTPGDYYFVAWGGLNNNDDHFTVPRDTEISHHNDLTCRMARKSDTEKGVSYSDVNLNALFHGSVNVSLPDQQGVHIVTVKMMKNTNNLVFHLMHTDGDLNPEDFQVVIEDEADTHSCLTMAHDNSIMKDEVIEHRPWEIRSAPFSQGSTKADEVDGGSMIVEFSTARLMLENRYTRDLVVYEKATGEEKFRFPFIDNAFWERSANYNSMGEQEYLDRQDNYNFAVILKGSKWQAVSITINGWKIVNDDVPL